MTALDKVKAFFKRTKSAKKKAVEQPETKAAEAPEKKAGETENMRQMKGGNVYRK